MKYPSRSSGRRASRASRVWAEPEARPVPAPVLAPVLAPVVVLLLAAGAASPRADLLHLRGGRTLVVKGCRTDGGEVRCRLAGGEIGWPADQVERIETEPRASGGAGRRPAPAAAPLPAIHEGPRETGPVPSVEGARARIEALDRALSSPGSDATSLRSQLAVLHAWLGFQAMTSGDFEEADRRYADALRNDPDLRVARLNRAAALINLSRYDAADRILRESLAGDPADARALTLLGESEVQQGRIAEGIRLWEKALEADPAADLQGRLERARRLLEAEEGFSVASGAHFALKFDGGQASPELAEEIVGYLEEAYRDLAARFSHEPESTIRTILYSTRAFQRATSSPDWVGGIFDGQIRIPVQGLTHLTPQIKRVLIHELAHCFVAARSKGNAPRWIQEGVAQVVEGSSAARDRAALIESFRAASGRPEGPEFSYPGALSRMEFFLERWSEGHLNDLLDHFGRGDDIDAALRSVTGLSHAEFVAAWGAWLER